jgi:hypothetical protein
METYGVARTMRRKKYEHELGSRQFLVCTQIFLMESLVGTLASAVMRRVGERKFLLLTSHYCTVSLGALIIGNRRFMSQSFSPVSASVSVAFKTWTDVSKQGVARTRLRS